MEVRDRLLSTSHGVLLTQREYFCCKRPPWNEEHAHLTFLLRFNLVCNYIFKAYCTSAEQQITTDDTDRAREHGVIPFKQLAFFPRKTPSTLLQIFAKAGYCPAAVRQSLWWFPHWKSIRLFHNKVRKGLRSCSFKISIRMIVWFLAGRYALTRTQTSLLRKWSIYRKGRMHIVL